MLARTLGLAGLTLEREKKSNQDIKKRGQNKEEKKMKAVKRKRKRKKKGEWFRSSTVYSQRLPVGGVVPDNLVDGSHCTAMRRRKGRGQGRGWVSKQHAGAHGHGGGNGCQVVPSLVFVEVGGQGSGVK